MEKVYELSKRRGQGGGQNIVSWYQTLLNYMACKPIWMKKHRLCLSAFMCDAHLQSQLNGVPSNLVVVRVIVMVYKWMHFILVLEFGLRTKLWSHQGVIPWLLLWDYVLKLLYQNYNLSFWTFIESSLHGRLWCGIEEKLIDLRDHEASHSDCVGLVILRLTHSDLLIWVDISSGGNQSCRCYPKP